MQVSLSKQNVRQDSRNPQSDHSNETIPEEEFHEPEETGKPS